MWTKVRDWAKDGGNKSDKKSDIVKEKEAEAWFVWLKERKKANEQRQESDAAWREQKRGKINKGRNTMTAAQTNCVEKKVQEFVKVIDNKRCN